MYNDPENQALLERLLNQNQTPMQKTGRAIGRFGALLTGHKPEEQDTSALDNMIKYNQLQTGSPEFKMKEAQTRADIELQKGLDLEKAKKAQAQADYDAALSSQGGQQPSQHQPMPIAGPSMPTAMPEKGGKIPQFVQVQAPGSKKYDASVGRFIDEPGKISMEKNPDYLTPEEQQVKIEKENSIRDTAQSNLQSIQEAKKGARFFGPLGNLPTLASPSSLPIVGGLTMGEPKLKGEYGDRKMWETNMNKIIAQNFVDLLGKMKSVSKNGSTGMGALSDTEGAFLRDASTALKKDLTPEQGMYYLNGMEKISQRILNGGQDSNIPTFSSEAEAEASGYKGDAIIAGKEANIS